jgi:periplasmic protein TonB
VNAVLKTPLDLQPYGAAELKATARTFLVRSLALGSAAWIVLFLAAGLTLVQFARAPFVKIPVATTIDRIPYPEHSQMPTSIAHPAPVQRHFEAATPMPKEVVPEQPGEVAPDPGAESARAEPTGAADGGAEKVSPVDPGEPSRIEWVYRDVEPKILERVEPRYSELGILAGQEGLVVVQVLIGREGEIVHMEVVRSVPMLDELALDALRRWRFSPALANGHPVAVWITVPFRFKLR